MFNIITQRLLWKEFRAQQLVWIAIAGELVLLQLWWGIKGHEYADLNLFSMAFVLTGVFAMTTSALLFAGESEAKTDGFLRQLPITPRQLIGGKLLYGGLALVAFLVFALLSTLIAGQMAGKYGGDASSPMGDPSVFALSIVGLAAWGLFYSLWTRKVLWTVIGAALTEIILGGIVHSLILGEYRWPDWVFYMIYAGIIATVVAIDARLLAKWCAGEQATSPTPLSMFAHSGEVASASDCSLPWLNAYRWSCLTGVCAGLGIIFLLVFEVNIRGKTVFHREDTLFVFGGGTCLGLLFAGAAAWLRSRSPATGSHQPVSSSPIGYIRVPTLRQVGAMFALGGLSLLVFCLGVICCYASLGFIVSLFLLPASLSQPGLGYTLGLATVTALGSGAALWGGDQWLQSMQRSGTFEWLHLLQQIHAVRHRAVQRIGPLLWIEARRALPFLLVGWVLLTLIGWYRPEMGDYGALSYFAIVIAALVCGLLTLLPDRTHGTLAFLTERGVSSTKIILSKLIVWGGTLLLMLSPPLLQGRVWKILDNPSQTVPQIANGLFAAQGGPYIIMGSAPSTSQYLFVLLLGTFTIGVLAAAWVRRPILAGIVGISLMLPWFGWVTMLMGTYAPIGFTAVVPIILFGLGILWTSQRTLLEQSSWRSKFGQIGWVLLVGFIGLQGYFHFRANEVPLVTHYEALKSLRNGQPSPLSHPASSWMYPFDESIPHATQLDALVDDESKKNALVQPPGFWGASHAFQMGIASLELDEEACDLDAAFEHLRKWHELTEKLAYASRDEDGWVDALNGHRVVLSAIRKWANHPQQTTERLEAAMTKLTPNQIGMSGATVIARQYADTRRSLETGISTDNIYRQSVTNISPVTQWFLAHTGEKERVRRLIDYYFYLSASSQVSQPSTTGQEFDHWTGTIRARVTAATLGVSLPEQRFNVRHRGQFELALSAETATRLVLHLQAWRLKHGSFPASFADLIAESGPINSRDFLTNESFSYEPQGFDRDLQAETIILIPARQPLLYSEGITEPRGVELAPPDPNGNPSNPLRYQARNFRSNQPSHMPTPVPPAIGRPANPNTIRFSVFGQVIDEDSLYRLPRTDQTAGEGHGGGVAAGGSSMSLEAGPAPSGEPAQPEPPIPGTNPQ